MMQRCAVYTRKSTEEGLDQRFNSLEAQRDACLAYIQSQSHAGWTAIEERYDDGGFSGGTLERPSLKRLLTHVRNRQIDVVVVHKVDRLTRSLMDFAKLAELFEAHNVAFVSVTQHLNSADSLGRLSLNILLSFAQFERELASERIRDKILASRRRGLWTGGNPPMGFDAANGSLVVNEAEANSVRHIFRRYVELGSVADLRRELDRAGIVSKIRPGVPKPRGGKPLSRGTLYSMLRNPLYVGKIRCGSEIVEAQHPAIVDAQLWQSARNMLARSQSTPSRREATSEQFVPLLTGKLFEKGGRLTHTYTIKNGRKYHYYVSAASTQGAGKAALRLPCSTFDKQVALAITQMLKDPDWLTVSGLLPGLDQGGLTQRSSFNLLEEIGNDTNLQATERILQAVTRLTVASDRIQGTLSYGNLMATFRDAGEVCVSPARSNRQIPFSAPIVVHRRGRCIKTVLLGKRSASDRGRLILQDVQRARDWYENLCSGRFRSLEEIAIAEKASPSTISRRITLAFLSPEIESSCRRGHLPDYVDNEWLRRQCPLPADWPTQHQLVWGKTKHLLD